MIKITDDHFVTHDKMVFRYVNYCFTVCLYRNVPVKVHTLYPVVFTGSEHG